MSAVLTLVCLNCQHHNTVTPTIDAGPEGRPVPGFIPETCTSCRRMIRPTSDDWNSVLFTLAGNGQLIPPDWWQTYARRHPPVPSDTPTA